jgi:uncharacterized protein (TIGR00730 family)
MIDEGEGKARNPVFPSASEDAARSRGAAGFPQIDAPSYRLAYTDLDFLMRDEVRPVRLQLELLKPELTLNDAGITSTIVVLGSARIPERDGAQRACEQAAAACARDPADADLARELERAQRVLAKARYYDEARRFAELASTPRKGRARHVIITGGGPGIMEAANRGAHDASAPSIGLNIVLPYEQFPNAYVTPDLCFRFHYFALRKMHFLMRARALVAFPGGFGTLDELFETLTLVQTRKISPIPILLFGREYWSRIVDFDAMVAEGVIAEQDLDLMRYVDDAMEAVRLIEELAP